MKKFSLAIIIILIAGGWYFRSDIQKLFHRLPALEQVASQNTVIQNIAKNIFTPGPLRGSDNYPDSVLTRQGVINWTNIQRNQNGGLAALRENEKLDASAQNKLSDMFKNQYFEHVSPSGKGPGDLAAVVGYDYILIGENLAMGNFKDDHALVEAWMNSPGHRANILNGKFEEIGVAVGKGKFKGNEVWIAVQEFGRPASSCPTVDMALKQKMDSLRADVDALEPQLQSLKQQIENSNPETQQEYDAYNEKIAEYNNLVKIYNNKVDQLKQVVGQYNAQVDAYNKCANS